MLEYNWLISKSERRAETPGQFIERCLRVEDHHYERINLLDELKSYNHQERNGLEKNHQFWSWQLLRRNPDFQEPWNLLSGIKKGEISFDTLIKFFVHFGIGIGLRPQDSLELYKPSRNFSKQYLPFRDGPLRGITPYFPEGFFAEGSDRLESKATLVDSKATDLILKFDLNKMTDVDATLEYVKKFLREAQDTHKIRHIASNTQDPDKRDHLVWPMKVDLEKGLKCFDLKVREKMDGCKPSSMEIHEVFGEAKEPKALDEQIKAVIPYIRDHKRLTPPYHNKKIP